ncbi:MAG: hypothetical protein RMK29_06740 [Myxococcales bacterium]|nr:hypothetical protein [Myxococcales bacterium]
MRACCLLRHVAAWVVVLLPADPVWASLPELAGLGTRSPALAGTGASFLRGYEATYTNPAGLAGTSRRLTLGTVLGAYRTTLDGHPYAIEPTAGLLIGATLPLPLGGVLRDRLALGLGFYLPVGLINRARLPAAEVPRAVLLDARTQVVSVLLGGGVRLPAGLSLGVSVLALAALTGEILVAPDGAGRITAASQSQLTVDYAPIVGVRWEGRRLLLGAVFRGASASRFRMVVRSQLGDTVPVDLPTLTIEGVAQYDPLQVAGEAALRLSERLLVAVQLVWKHMSAFPPPLGKATAGADDPPPPGFHDTVVPRLSLEWHMAEQGRATLRLGYFFEWSPTPRDEVGRALLDADRHVVCAGLGHQLPRLPLHLEGFLQWHQLAAGWRLAGNFLLGGLSVGVDL